MEAVLLSNVTKTYGMGKERVLALRGVSLSIEKGAFYAIQGPSGSGKSTLMNMIGALDIPDEGSVSILGKNVGMLSEDALSELRGKTIGFVFQQFNLVPNMNALENVMLPMIFQGADEDSRRERAASILEAVGLGDRMRHMPSQISGGQRQRIAIARALANEPEVILADEPTGNLDSKTGKEVFKLLRRLNARGKTVVLITHDDDLAAGAETTAFIKDGAIVNKLHGRKR